MKAGVAVGDRLERLKASSTGRVSSLRGLQFLVFGVFVVSRLHNYRISCGLALVSYSPKACQTRGGSVAPGGVVHTPDCPSAGTLH